MRSRLAVDCQVGRQDDFRHLLRGGSGYQRGDVEVFRADTVKRRQAPAQNSCGPTFASGDLSS